LTWKRQYDQSSIQQQHKDALTKVNQKCSSFGKNGIAKLGETVAIWSEESMKDVCWMSWMLFLEKERFERQRKFTESRAGSLNSTRSKQWQRCYQRCLTVVFILLQLTSFAFCVALAIAILEVVDTAQWLNEKELVMILLLVSSLHMLVTVLWSCSHMCTRRKHKSAEVWPAKSSTALVPPDASRSRQMSGP